MSLAYILFVLLCLGLTALIGAATVATARLLRRWTPPGNLLLMPGENLLRVALTAAGVGLGLLSGLPFATLGWQMDGWPMNVALGVLVGLALAAFFYVATGWMIRRTGERFYSSLILRYIVPHSGREMLLVCLALIPAVFLEELLFRSLWIGGFSPLLSPPLLLVISSVIFGLFHTPQGVWGVLGTGLAGAIFGGLFLWTGGLLMPLVAHYVVNVAQIALAWRRWDADDADQADPSG